MAAPRDQARRQAARRRNLQRVLQPRHVAVIGGDAAEQAVRQLDGLGFAGAVWPVNARRRAMHGHPCYASIADLPEAPDAAVVAVPAPACPGVFAELDARGAGGGICFAAGFAEDGVADIERELVTAAGDCALVGPNCHGILNYLDGVALWPDDHGSEASDAGFALISQSGNVALNATFQQRGAPLGYVISTGNQAQLEVGDFIDVLIEDPRVHAIGLFIEGLRDIAGFARAAWRALEAGVPVVALKVGASSEGARATLSHTGALAGSDTVYQSLFDRLGIRRAHTPAELLETLKLLSVTGALPGRRMLSLSCSGGEAALMGDRLAAVGVSCPAPSPTAADGIAAAFRIPRASVGNPLDYNTHIWGDAAASARGFATALADGYDAAVLVVDFPPPGRSQPDNWRAAMDGFLEAHASVGGHAAVLATLPEALPDTARRACVAAGVTPLQGLDEGVRALAHASAWSERRAQLLESGAWSGPLAVGEVAGGSALDEADSKAGLAAHGLAVPASTIVAATEAPGAAAEQVGFPVALKGLGPGLAHKTEMGAVALGLGDATAVDGAATTIERSVDAAGQRVERWLVEHMVADAIAELIVGVVHDPLGGPMLMVGTGGILAELTRDTRTVLLPASRDEIREAIERLEVAALLAGYRGRPAGDLEAAVDACMAVADFAVNHAGELAELDVNPLLVRPAGQGAVAADALVRFRAGAEAEAKPAAPANAG